MHEHILSYTYTHKYTNILISIYTLAHTHAISILFHYFYIISISCSNTSFCILLNYKILLFHFISHLIKPHFRASVNNWNCVIK